MRFFSRFFSIPDFGGRAATPVYGWPVPIRTDAPAGHAQITALAEAIEDTMQANVAAASGHVVATAAGTALPTATAVKVPLTSVEASGATVSGTDITIGSAGWWEFHSSIQYSIAPAANQRFFISIDAAGKIWRQSPGFGEGFTSTSGLQRFAAGDKVNITVYQASGAAATVTNLYIAARKIGA